MAGTHHEFRPTFLCSTFGPNPVALTLQPGESVTTWCLDAAGRDEKDHELRPDQLYRPPGNYY